MSESEDEFFGLDSGSELGEPEDTSSSDEGVPGSKRNSFFGALELEHVGFLPSPHPPLPPPARRTSQGLPRGARLAKTSLDLHAQTAAAVDDAPDAHTLRPFQPPPRQSSVPSIAFSHRTDKDTLPQRPPLPRERTLSVPPQDSVSHRRSSFYGIDGHTQPGAAPTARPRRSSFTGSGPSSWPKRSSQPEIADRRSLSLASASPSVCNLDLTTPPFPTVPLLDHSHLQVGAKAALLSHAKTLALYRANAKKTSDPDVLFDFAALMLSVSRDLADDEAADEDPPPPSGQAAADATAAAAAPASSGASGLLDIRPPKDAKDGRRASFHLSRRRGSPSSSSSSIFRASSHSDPLEAAAAATGTAGSLPSASSSETDLPQTKRNNLLREAAGLLRKLAHNGHVPAQCLLADLYASGALSAKGRQEHEKAFPLFVLAAKHGHVDAAFRTAQCCEHALGCRRDAAKAVQWYKKAGSQSHPEAMFRLGLAEIQGELGLQGRQKEGFKWLKRAAELADQPDCPPASVEALFELGLLHVRGIEHVVFVDADYAAECWARAAELGHAKSAFTLGEGYEYGRMGLPQDSALSIHYYNIAAQQGHPEACFALTAWYLIGSPGVLPQSDTEAYLWAKKAAAQALPKAEYAVGYFSENGMGTPKDLTEAMMWYRRAAEHGDARAIARLKGPQPTTPLGPRSNSLGRSGTDLHSRHDRSALRKAKTDSDCIIS